MKGCGFMNQQQMIILIDKLENISGKLVKSVDAETTIDTKLLAHDANVELLEVIQTLIDHAKNMES
jgi:hypothetical protein